MSDEEKGTVGEEQSEDAEDLDYKVEFENLKVEATKKERAYKKEIGGLDKKVTELLEAKSETDEQLKKLERKSLPADRLREVLAQEEAQRIAQKDAELAQAQQKLEQYELKENRVKILTQKKAHPFIISLLTENQPADVDEYMDFVEDKMQEFEGVLLDNSSKWRATSMPQTGDGGRKSVAVPTDKDWGTMRSEDRDAFARSLTKDQLEKMIQQDMRK